MRKTIHEKLQTIIELNQEEKEQLNAISLVIKAVEDRLLDTVLRHYIEREYEGKFLIWAEVRRRQWRLCTRNKSFNVIPLIEAPKDLRFSVHIYLNDFLDEIIKEMHESAQKLKKG